MQIKRGDYAVWQPGNHQTPVPCELIRTENSLWLVKCFGTQGSYLRWVSQNDLSQPTNQRTAHD